MEQVRELLPQLLARKQRALLDEVMHSNALLAKVCLTTSLTTYVC
jgi:hypothetical protein